MNRELIIKASPMIFIALICGVALAIANNSSLPRIEQQQQEYEQAQLLDVIGSEDYKIVLTEPPSKTRYWLKKDQQFVGYLDQIATQEGYNGEIRFWLATEKTRKNNSNLRILGVRVTEHRETPGLGDKLDIAVSDWVLGFNGKDSHGTNWDVEKYGGDFDQFSGATITPRAIVRRIEKHLEQLEREQPLTTQKQTGAGS